MTPALAVVVLAGGEGRRMGGGKPLRLLHDRSLISLALDRARSWSPLVAVSVRSPDQVGELDAPLILDSQDVAGPLAGLAAALAFASRASASRLLTLPCDTPDLPDDLARRLAEALGRGAGAAVARCDGRLHPICAVWDVIAARTDLPGYIAEGRSSVRGFAETVGLQAVDWDAGSAPAFRNLNTLMDLRDAARLAGPWRRGGPPPAFASPLP
jgi:molybdopterin-guanine dinucleotide biosynthesis protein A